MLKNIPKINRDALSALEELTAFLQILEERIISEVKPISDIVEGADISSELKALLSSLDKMRSHSLTKFLSDTQINDLISIFEDHGKTGYIRSAEKICSVKEMLLSVLASEKDKLEKEEKIYTVIAVASAAALFILLI